jgi:sodium-coupled neutral amino acid transporter 10
MLQGVLVSLPVMAYGFTAHQYYMGIYTMLKAPTIRKMKLVTDTALLVCSGVYWTVGVGGYATFGDRTSGDVIRNFGGQRSVGMWGAYERALKLCYGMAVLGNIPLVILPFSSILSPLLPEDSKLKQQTSSLTGACTVAGAKCCTAATFSGCGGSNGNGMHGQKARFSGSGGGSGDRQPASGEGYECAGGELAVQLNAEALVLEAPAWQQHNGTGGIDSSVADLSSSRGHGWQAQQPLLRTQAQQPPTRQQQQQEAQPLLQEVRAGSPEEAPEHPHLTRDAARAAHMLTGPQHTLVVVLVLGLGLASAVWLPNVELIFGLTGSTASVLAAFIMPALCFLRLYDMAPELGSGKRAAALGTGSSLWRLLKQAVCCCGCYGLGSVLNPVGRARHRGFGPRPARHSSPGASKRPYSSNGSSSWGQLHGNGDQGGSSSPSKVWGPVLVVPELRAQWACRQRLAFTLLAFGLISGLLCTDAILSSISEEKAVVQLAQVGAPALAPRPVS